MDFHFATAWETIADTVPERPALICGDVIDEAGLIDFARGQLAGFKLPKYVLAVDAVRRAPDGKANYKWARQYAAERLGVAS